MRIRKGKKSGSKNHQGGKKKARGKKKKVSIARKSFLINFVSTKSTNIEIIEKTITANCQLFFFFLKRKKPIVIKNKPDGTSIKTKKNIMLGHMDEIEEVTIGGIIISNIPFIIVSQAAIFVFIGSESFCSTLFSKFC